MKSAPFREKRYFLKSLAIAALGVAVMLLFHWSLWSDLRSFLYRALHKIKKTPKPLQSQKSIIADLPGTGKRISVETALNSRCTSDYDGNPEIFHWGMFDREKKLSEDHINEVIELSRIPRFTQIGMSVNVKENILTLSVDTKALSGDDRKKVMIENGMLQQSICLVCAALGIGMVFNAFKNKEKQLGKNSHDTIRLVLDASLPPYDGSFWTAGAPANRKPWRPGNLPGPQRDGGLPLIEVLSTLQTAETGLAADESELSQLLWAARGRTPHLYKSKPWGMTIPTSGGQQNNSSVFVLKKRHVFRYANWDSNRPTHALMPVGELTTKDFESLDDLIAYSDVCIILAGNQDNDKTLWEIGYQLLNTMLQAKSLGISYKAHILDDNQSSRMRIPGIHQIAGLVAL
jgi:hypothetical protein